MSHVNRKARLINHLASVRGCDRLAHFASGGDLASWRGVHLVSVDRHAEMEKRACRRRVKDED